MFGSRKLNEKLDFAGAGIVAAQAVSACHLAGNPPSFENCMKAADFWLDWENNPKSAELLAGAVRVHLSRMVDAAEYLRKLD